MQVNLKQHEIEAALKNFISQQGISLVGKRVGISFTAGRKETGISADMTIEESDIPGFNDAADTETTVILPLATVAQLTPLAAVIVTQVAEVPAAEDVVDAPAQAEEAQNEGEVLKAPSLFG